MGIIVALLKGSKGIALFLRIKNTLRMEHHESSKSPPGFPLMLSVFKLGLQTLQLLAFLSHSIHLVKAAFMGCRFRGDGFSKPKIQQSPDGAALDGEALTCSCTFRQQAHFLKSSAAQSLESSQSAADPDRWDIGSPPGSLFWAGLTMEHGSVSHPGPWPPLLGPS